MASPVDQTAFGGHLLGLPTTTAGWALYLVMFSAMALAGWQLVFARPPAPRNAPALWAAYDWPAIGSALTFYKRPRDMVLEGIRASKHGSFSFYVGKKHVVAVGGPAGRRVFFESRALSHLHGTVDLVPGLPPAPREPEAGTRFLAKTIVAMTRSETLARRLPAMCRDVRELCDMLAAQHPSESSPEWRVTDVFDTVYSVVLQMLSRVMGATEVSEDPRHRARLLSAFEMLEASASTAGVIFPWLPTMFTPSWARRLVIGAALYRTFSSIIQTRQNTDRREDDALQDLLDQKTPLSDNIQFQASIIFVGLLTTSVGSGWLLIMLVSHPQWQARCRDEVDRVVSAHRRSADQAAGDVLGDLPLQVWESEFPVLDACLREVTRLSVVSAVFRKNTSGRDLPIGDTGEVIPAGSYATYVFDDVHQDEGLYPDAGAFNPGRYLDGERRGAKGEPHTHVGWGSGLHLCLGMRLATLEIIILMAHFIASFEFGLSDKRGVISSEKPPFPDRNILLTAKPKSPVYLRYKARA